MVLSKFRDPPRRLNPSLGKVEGALHDSFLSRESVRPCCRVTGTGVPRLQLRGLCVLRLRSGSPEDEPGSNKYLGRRLLILFLLQQESSESSLSRNQQSDGAGRLGRRQLQQLVCWPDVSQHRAFDAAEAAEPCHGRGPIKAGA